VVRWASTGPMCPVGCVWGTRVQRQTRRRKSRVPCPTLHADADHTEPTGHTQRAVGHGWMVCACLSVRPSVCPSVCLSVCRLSDVLPIDVLGGMVCIDGYALCDGVQQLLPQDGRTRVRRQVNLEEAGM